MELEEQAALNRHQSHIDGVSETAKSHVFHVQEVVAGQNQKKQEEKAKLEQKLDAATGRRQEHLEKTVVEKNANAEAKREQAREILKQKEADIQKQQEEKLNAAAGRRQEHLEKNVLEKAAAVETRRQQVLSNLEQEKDEKLQKVTKKMEDADAARQMHQDAVVEKASSMGSKAIQRGEQVLKGIEEELERKGNAIVEKLQMAEARRAEYQASPRKPKSGVLGGFESPKASPTNASPAKKSFKESAAKVETTTAAAPTHKELVIFGVRMNPILGLFFAIVFSMIWNLFF
jgi:hypothetical protein